MATAAVMRRRFDELNQPFHDKDVPPLPVRWFHAADSPIRLETEQSSSTEKPSRKPPTQWIPFSKRDSAALERAFMSDEERPVIPVNEDYLFEVDVTQRRITPIYWKGPVYEVRRATWFIQGDSSSKWTPCDESLSEQLELGYRKYRPWTQNDILPSSSSSTPRSSRPGTPSSKADSEQGDKRPSEKRPEEKNDKAGNSADKKDESNAAAEKAADREMAIEEKKLEKTLESHPVEKQWNLFGKFLGQYAVYTGICTAWLLSDSYSSKISKQIYTRLTKNNLGGTRLIRGYPDVERITASTAFTARFTSTSADKKGPEKKDTSRNDSDLPTEDATKEEDESSDIRREVEDYANEDSEEDARPIKHLIFCIHGIGQKFTEKMDKNFVHDVNVFRRTFKSAFSTVTAQSGAGAMNGVQILPIMWRPDIKFGMASQENASEQDMGIPDAEDGCPTLQELTLEGVPNIRMMVSDVLLDIPLYMTPKYHDQMMRIVAKEINCVYRLFLDRNPTFVQQGGQCHIFGHSLGSVLAFDVVSSQPFTQTEKETISHLSKYNPECQNPPILDFPVTNFFAIGSPIGLLLLLKGNKITSRALLAKDAASEDQTSIPQCYPAITNLYNIFHKADPVAYRIEPLIARHYTANLKPEPVPYFKGGLKSVLDAGYTVGSGLANRAGTMLSMMKSGIATNLFMRGLGIKKEHLDMDMAAQQPDGDGTSTEGQTLNHGKPAEGEEGGEHTAEEMPPIQPFLSFAQYTRGAQRLRAMNVNGRVDYCLQEGYLENPYLSALSVHLNYWSDVDVAGFIVRELYKTEGHSSAV
ncbi:hypothetical protein BZG36_00059 [Bifiguratus adelaidae]|uniref:DDHD domain-containing protein n=1 Tax=Bifiguratus adelaidae TaxID=1938954 RepID=A0A261Y8L4_9FUNG|nr:hypothetical protein BZG36_00059 [Bifiguratus adelaidae]